jgi:lysophospholipase L1-like esterase
MWVSYTGTQLDYAVSYLTKNRDTKLVTINIGGNDLGLLQLTCAGDLNCEVLGLPGVLAAYGMNLNRIFSHLRDEARYKGPIVLLTYYVSNYNDPAQVGAFSALNAIASSIATAFGAKIADGFTAFQAASAGKGGDACAAGLLATLPDGSCDTHPSIQGQRLLADTVMAILEEKKAKAKSND